MVEQVFGVQLLLQQVVAYGLKLIFVSPHEDGVYLAALPPILQFCQFGACFAGRVVQIAEVCGADGAALMKSRVVSLGDYFSTSMAGDVHLGSCAPESIPGNYTLATFCSSIVLVIRCAQVRRGPDQLATAASRFWYRFFCLFLFDNDRFAMNPLVNVDGVEAEYIFGFEFFLFFGVSLLIGVGFEIIFDDAGECCISNSRGDFLPALYAGIFFAVDKFSEAASAESVVAGLDGDGDGHDLIAERAGDLVFDGLCELAGRLFCFLLFLLLLFILFLLFCLLFLSLFSYLLLLLLFLLFLLFVYGQLKGESDCFVEGHFAWNQQPDLIQI